MIIGLVDMIVEDVIWCCVFEIECCVDVKWLYIVFNGFEGVVCVLVKIIIRIVGKC